jgi:hypothetical protein
MSDDALHQLIADLERAQAAAAAFAGEAPLGVRAVEAAPGRRAYLCAFTGPRFLCLDDAMGPARELESVRAVAACALLVEHAEGLIDGGEFDLLAAACVSLSGAVEANDLGRVLNGLQGTARQLSEWCAAPERAVASLAAVDQASSLHDEARRWYERFLEGTEPLVEMQDRLSDELIAGLKEVDEAAARSGVTQPIASAIAQAMEALDAGAQEMVDVSVVPLVPGG